MSKIVTVPFRLLGNSIVIKAKVQGIDAEFVLDTGDALGPAFNGSDFQRFSLPSGGPIGVSGAGGSSSAYRTWADIELGGVPFLHEEGIIDLQLQGLSLIGLPFFIAKTEKLCIDFNAMTLSFDAQTDGDERAELAASEASAATVKPGKGEAINVVFDSASTDDEAW